MSDILRWTEEELVVARAAAAAAVDRAEALVELRGLLLERAAELGTVTLTAEQFEDGLSDEEKRAQFTAIARRAADPEETPNAA